MLTFDAIRDVERREKENKRIQKLPDNFIEDLKDYLRKKEKTEKTSSDIMELENVKSTIKRFFDLREQKITEISLFTTRTGMPAENLTEKERNLHLEIVENLKRYREYFFEEIHKSPDVQKHRDIPEMSKDISEENVEIKKAPKEMPNVKTKYQVIAKIPSFVGPDMKVYELKEGEIVDLPKALNDLLLKNGVIKDVYN